ncbi:integrase [Streptomyces sp. NPDC056501]|uniref:integrase n=1 Tax=Streptomyces sp. NPDC056501 TaxID=3345841 RepID=UPI00367CC34A
MRSPPTSNDSAWRGGAGISFWSYSGVDPAEYARRAGQTIEVLFHFYVKLLDGVREQANRLIEQPMEEWDRIHRGGTPAGGPSLDRK